MSSIHVSGPYPLPVKIVGDDIELGGVELKDGTSDNRAAIDSSGALSVKQDRATSSMAAALATDALMNNLTALTPLFALANVAASQTDSSIVAAVSNKKIRVIALVCVCGTSATNITFNTKPAGAGTAISQAFANAANGGIVLPFSPVGWFETAVGEGLTVTTGAGATTGVDVVYVTV